MKKIMIYLFILISFGCSMGLNYDKEQVSKEDLLAPYVELYGDVDNENITKTYEDGTPRNVVIYWNYQIGIVNDLGSTSQVYIVIWYNNEINSFWDYGWNLLNKERYL